MQCLPFLQTLLTMEAMAEYTDAARARVAAGDTGYQSALIEAEKLEELLSTGTLGGRAQIQQQDPRSH